MKKILFVSFAPKHTSFVRRVRDAQGGSFELEVYSTRVDRNAQSILHRLLTFSHVRLLFNLLKSDAEVIWLWGIDVCLVGSLVKFLRPRKTIVWDISDLHPRLLENSFQARFLQHVERTLLQKVNWLLLTSPEFFDKYYYRWIERQKVCVVENYLLNSLRQNAPAPPPELGKLKIIYTGLFRSEHLLRLLAKVAVELPKEIEFHLHGYCSKNVDERLLQELKTKDNIIVHGSYSMEDLPKIHAGAHLIFGFLDETADLNERWLLPNRIYHAGAFRRPILTNRATFTGEIVLKRGLGAVCDLSVSEIVSTLRKMTANSGEVYFKLVASIPQDGDYFLDGHYRRFMERVAADL